MDVSTIRARAKRQLNEPTGTDEGLWDDDDYLNAMNEAQDDFALATKCLKTYADFTTADDTSLYDMSEDSLSNFIDIAQVRYYTDDDVYRVLRRLSRDELSMHQSEREDVTADPYFYCYEDRTIEFEHDTNADDTVRVYYYKLPAEMDDDADVSDIPTKFHQALLMYVCWKFAEADDLDAQRTGYFKMEYERWIQRAKMVLNPAGSSYGAMKDDTRVPYV